jgi:hypothetical protein
LKSSERLHIDSIECDLDEEMDNEYYTGKNVKDSFINKRKEFSSINPSVLGREKVNNSEIVNPKSAFDFKRKPNGTNATKESFVIPN